MPIHLKTLFFKNYYNEDVKKVIGMIKNALQNIDSNTCRIFWYKIEK